MANKPKLLILNGSHSEIPLIRAARKLGYYVITTGNLPDLPGHQFSDEYHFGDFSNEESMLDLARKLGIDRVCSSANDFGIISAAYVGELLGLPGHDSYETALLLHHKDRFKQFARQYDIQTPRALSFSAREDALVSLSGFQLPVMVKPIDLTGGKGVTKVTRSEELNQAVEKAFQVSRVGNIVIEEFFSGTQHSFSCFLVGQRVHAYFSDNEFSYLNPYLVSTSSAPAQAVEVYADRLIAEAEKTASLLNLVDGVLHFQFLANGSDFQIIEMTRRCSGDLYPYPVSIATGIDWAEWLLLAETGVDCGQLPGIRQSGFCGRHCVMSSDNGIVVDVKIDGKLGPFIVDSLMWWQPGEEITDYKVQKLGILIFSFPSRDVMDEVIGAINTLVTVVLE